MIEPNEEQSAKNYILIIYVYFLRASYANFKQGDGQESDESSKQLRTLLMTYFELYKQCSLYRGQGGTFALQQQLQSNISALFEIEHFDEAQIQKLVGDLVCIFQTVKPLDQEMYRRIVCSIFVLNGGMGSCGLASAELTEALYVLYKEGSITDVSIFVPLVTNSKMSAAIMEKLMVSLILNPEVKFHGQKREDNIFYMHIDDYVNKVIMNSNSHLSDKDKIEVVSKILATNSPESHERLELHNEILRR